SITQLFLQLQKNVECVSEEQKSRVSSTRLLKNLVRSLRHCVVFFVNLGILDTHCIKVFLNSSQHKGWTTNKVHQFFVVLGQVFQHDFLGDVTTMRIFF